ncbi:Homocysteine S-methyltransferase 4 [Dichanthelium oligosanthes]|uniref:Homocysteine S-methyltransferase 4 n=1 Tax=Dichanthelium oligosanthes TaxID=888268 RepID=A0A1E5VES7_9POAL|nr:Homocysteine S-methyltransferase 4 [Dichanthelium oligosanthes]
MGLGDGGSGDAAGALRGFVRDCGRRAGARWWTWGLATELWSAECLAIAPAPHPQGPSGLPRSRRECIISASYQYHVVTTERSTGRRPRSSGSNRGASGGKRARRCCVVACTSRREARRVFVEGGRQSSRQPRPPLQVPASIGSYGAYLADGSESVTKEALKNFHRRRLQVLADAGPDLIAFETIPNKLEAQAYAELLEESDIRIPAWFSFTSKDGVNAASGDPIAECAAVAESCERVAAFGVNCTAPRLVHGLILSIKEVTSKPIVVYPNSGETYIAERKEWVDTTGATGTDFVPCVGEWRLAGAALIGGVLQDEPGHGEGHRAGAARAGRRRIHDIPAAAVL